MSMRFLGTTLAATAGLVTAEIKSSLDASTFQKLILKNKGWTSKAVIHIKKKYGYDQHDMTEKITEGLRKDPTSYAFDLELDMAPYQGSRDENEPESDWQVREKKQKKADQELASKLGIDKEDDLPMIVVLDGGFAPENRVGAMKKMKVQEKKYSSDEDETEKPPETTFEDVNKFLADSGLILIESSAAPLEVSSEEETLLEEFMGAKDKAAAEAIIAKVKELKNESKQSKMLVKVMNAAAKFNKGIKAYMEKETKRISGMLASNAITPAKKAELQIKKNILYHATESTNVGDDKEEL